MTEIVRADTSRLVRQFVELPYEMYAGHPHWVPPLRRDEHKRLSSRHNPFFAHGEIELWLAVNGRETFGRVAVISDRLHDEKHGDKLTWFGFFEARDQPTGALLLDRVLQRARERGSRAVRGPANPSLNESAGLLVDAFDRDPYALMPYNPPEYAGFIESAGFTKVKDLLAWEIDAQATMPDRIVRVSRRAAERHRVVVRRVDLRNFDRDLQVMTTIYRAAWADNWGFVPPTDAEIRQLAVDLRPVIDPKMVLFAEIDGRAVGCAVAIPNFNQVLKRMNGRLLPFGILHFLRRRTLITQVRVILLGLLPEFRRAGLYPLLIDHLAMNARGTYKDAELSWTLEDNPEVNAGIEAAGGRRYKTYRLYERALR